MSVSQINFLTFVLCIIVAHIIYSMGFLKVAANSSSKSRHGLVEAKALPNQNTTITLSDLTESIDCTEDRIEAIEVGRQCSRRCRRDIPCENARKQCLCDGLCGLSCIKPDLNCAELPRIENGDYYPKSTRFNAKVIYQCDPGYYLFGSRERVCQGDEDWSGTPVECLKEPQCHNPFKVNHARNPSDGYYRLNDKVNYSCYPGYHSRGSSEAVCKLVKLNQTSWFWNNDQTFRCIPKSCGDPGPVENGKIQGDSFIIASSILYTCNEGFEMIGQARRYCQSDNQWSGQPPQCEPVTCNPTDHLENGKINYAYPLVFNSTVEYSCDFGFRLSGPQRRKCGPEGKLIGDAPTCIEIDCGQIGPLHNGYIKGYSTRMGDRKEFVCREGTKFVGDKKETVCLDSGQWSHPLPKCLGPCTIPPIENANKIYIVQQAEIEMNSTSEVVLKSTEPGSLVVHGSLLEVICRGSYEVEEMMNEQNVLQAPICRNSSWSYKPLCKPLSCRKTPTIPKNGRLRVHSIEHGSKGYIHCLDGYHLEGKNIIECDKGAWTQTNATCLEIYCKYPGNIEHGRVLLVGLTGMYDYRTYIKRVSTHRQIAYECDPGFRLNDGAPSGATCINGQWRPEGVPLCVKE